jgi:spore coat protein U-like protein
MKYRWSHRRLLAAAVSSLSLCGAALADDTANLTVSATVAPTCKLTTGPTLSFGTVNPLANNDAQGNIQWVCTNGFNTAIKLGAGSTAGGTISNRLMSDGGTGKLAYQLYTDSARTTVFGDGTAGSSTVAVSGAGYASPANVTVYGRVLGSAAGAATAGSYTDTVLVTITF